MSPATSIALALALAAPSVAPSIAQPLDREPLDREHSDDALRARIAETAVRQVDRIDVAWQEQQRDCAGLVRYAYRSAFKELRPARLRTPLFLDARDAPSDFADAETLIRHSFVHLGGSAALARAQSGDVLAFRQDRGDGDVVWHLMLVVAAAPGRELYVVYHPGAPGAAVRSGSVASLSRDAPLEWRPVDDNAAFLGVFRFRELAADAARSPRSPPSASSSSAASSASLVGAPHG